MNEEPTRSQILIEKLSKIIAEAAPGERLLTEPELAKQLGVSRATLREAMRTFETQGLIRRRQGSGTYVSHPSHVIDSGLEVLESIDTLAKRIGLDVTPGELRANPRPATQDEAEALVIEPGTEVTHIARIMQAELRPVAYLVDVLPVDVLTTADLGEGFTGSVLDLLLSLGTYKLESSRTEINAVTASSEVARALGIQRGDVLLRFNARLFSSEGRVIDYSQSYFLPGYFHFHVVRRVGRS